MTQLAASTLRDFVTSLSSEAPAPGGGSASAAAGAAGAALLHMVVKLTLGKEKYKDAWGALEPHLRQLAESQSRLLELVDEDTQAYEGIVAARKLPKETPEQKTVRQEAIDDATIVATTVPMQSAFYAEKALAAAAEILEKGNPNAASDAYVGSLLLATSIEGALANVRINMPGVRDLELAKGFREDGIDLERKTKKHMAAVRDVARAKTVAL